MKWSRCLLLFYKIFWCIHQCWRYLYVTGSCHRIINCGRWRLDQADSLSPLNMRSIVRLSQIYFCLSIANDKKTRLILRIKQLFRQKSHDNNINSDQRFLRLWETLNIASSSNIALILYLHQKWAKSLVTSFLSLQYYDVCLNQQANSGCACILRRYNFIIPIIQTTHILLILICAMQR